MTAFYPRILIIGNSFDTRSGGGITLSNLFKGWEKENIAVAASGITELDFNICKKYYRLGSSERHIRFPVNNIGKKSFVESGNISATENADIHKISDVRKRSIIANFFRSIYYKIYDFIGLEHYSYRLKASIEFKKWVEEFDPDIIYCQLSTLETTLFINDLHFQFKKPIAIHFMDDWPVTITNRQKGVFKKYWQKTVNRQLRRLLSNTTILLSISEAMSDEYLLRYGLKFAPFHNPVDIQYWDSFTKKDYEFQETFKILYAGRIGTGIQYCFYDIAGAIEILNCNGYKIELQIQTTTNNAILEDLKKFDFIKLLPMVSYRDLPRRMIAADLLLLPNDLDYRSIDFLKFSMPTKASEYMISGTPILVYAHEQTALAKYASKHAWAYVVNNSGIALYEGISKLYTDKSLRINLAKNAREVAIRNEDAKIVRENFRKSFNLIDNNAHLA